MCGLVGIIGDVNSVASRKMFTTMLFLDTLRGEDSTGVYAINYKDNEVNILKDALQAPDFIQEKPYEDMMRVSNRYSALIGHNRAATVGVVNKRNAHPFEHGDITMVHNGTLRNEHMLDTYKDFYVDSEMLCGDFNKNGMKNTIMKVNGAFALIWHDKSDNTVNILRNSERPLSYAVFQAQSSANVLIGSPFLAVASEPWMMTVAASRSGIKMISPDIKSVKVGEHVKIDIDGMYLERDADMLLTHTETEEVPLFTSTTHVGGRTWTGKNVEYIHSTKSKANKTKKLPASGNTASTQCSVSGLADNIMYSFVPMWAYEHHGKYIATGTATCGRYVRCIVEKDVHDQIIQPSNRALQNNIQRITAPKVGSITESPSQNGGKQVKSYLILDSTITDKAVIAKKKQRVI